MVKTGEIDAFVSVPTDERLTYAISSREEIYRVEMRTTVKRGSLAEKMLTEKPNPKTLRSLRMCDILANGWGKDFAMKHTLQPVTVLNVAGCLRMVRKGRVDATLQSSVVASREIRTQNLEKDLFILPPVYGTMVFTVLLSRKSAAGQEFIDRFDRTLRQMKQDGSYVRLLKHLN